MRFEVLYVSFVQVSLWTCTLFAWLLTSSYSHFALFVHFAVWTCAVIVPFTSHHVQFQLAFMLGAIVSFFVWSFDSAVTSAWFVHMLCILQSCVSYRVFEPESRVDDSQ